MIIGVVKEIKPHENRVGLVPSGVRSLVNAGSTVYVETRAGEGSGILDTEYAQAGAKILSTAKEVWGSCDLIIKVKEPIASEFDLIRENQTLYTYLHLAILPELAQVLLKKKVTAIGYETIQLPSGALPLLKPMSEVAGRMSVQIGASYLQREHGGRGVLLGGVPGVPRGNVTIIGAGVVGTNACKMAVGMGASTTVIDLNVDRLEYLDDLFGNQITTLCSNSENIERSVLEADLLIGGVLIPGAKAPKLVTKAMVEKMKPGSVIVDVAVDQGGCVETCRPTSHDKPTYLESGVIHYCVTNIPGAVSRTSTYALTNVTMKYAQKMAKLGIEQAIKSDAALQKGVNTFRGQITYEAVASALGHPFTELKGVL